MRLFLFALAMISSWVSANAQAGKFEYIESGLTLRLEAPISESGVRKFVLGIQTNDVYECSKTFIENEVLLQGNKLLVKVKGVRIPEPCVPEMGTAKAKLDLSSLKPGRYPVRVSVNRQVFKAQLEISADYFDFLISENEDPTLFRIYNGRLHVIPDNAIWGVCEYKDPGAKGDAIKFMKELEVAGAKLTQLAPGNYDDFYLHQIGTTEEKVLAADAYEYPFIYTYTGAIEPIKEILTAFTGKVNITLRNSKGQVLKNF